MKLTQKQENVMMFGISGILMGILAYYPINGVPIVSKLDFYLEPPRWGVLFHPEFWLLMGMSVLPIFAIWKLMKILYWPRSYECKILRILAILMLWTMIQPHPQNGPIWVNIWFEYFINNDCISKYFIISYIFVIPAMSLATSFITEEAEQ